MAATAEEKKEREWGVSTSFSFPLFAVKISVILYSLTNFKTGRRYWPANRASSSPLKTAKPSTAIELEDISREISAAIDQPRQPSSPIDEEGSKNASIFTQLFGMKQEKVF
jgi:hypothetical protein